MKKLAVVLIGAGFVTFAHAQAQAACGTLKVSKGDVKIQSKDGKESPAGEGAKICSGDTIISGKESRAKIVMEDGNELNISPESKIALEQYEFKPAENKKKVLLNVLSGKVRAATKQENMYNDKSKDGSDNTFQVRTKSAVAGVRGTDFLTGYNPSNNKSELITFKGKVEFGQPGPGGKILNPVQVGAGSKSEVMLGQPPVPPKIVSPSEMKQLDSDTKADLGGAPGSNAPGQARGGGEKSDREPAGEGGMLDSKDLASAPSNSGGGPTFGSGPDTFPGPPPPPPKPPELPKCEYCSSVQGNGKVNIIITTPQ